MYSLKQQVTNIKVKLVKSIYLLKQFKAMQKLERENAELKQMRQRQQGMEAAQQKLNQWYAEGLIDRDFYLHQDTDAITNFTSGLAAGMYHNCAISSYLGYVTTFEESTGLDSNECVAMATIATDDGVNQTYKMYFYDEDDVKTYISIYKNNTYPLSY